jgi:hypothetical protein
VTTQIMPGRRPVAVRIGLAIGAAILLLFFLNVWVGPVALPQRAAVMIGEKAGDIRQAALHALRGAPPPVPQLVPWDIDRTVKTAAGILAGLAATLAACGAILREPPRAAVAAIVLAAGAILPQGLASALLLLIGTLSLGAASCPSSWLKYPDAPSHSAPSASRIWRNSAT